MRQKINPQMSLFTSVTSKRIAKELEQISKVLDETPKLVEIVYEDLIRTVRADTGREGMSAEQVLRCAILKQYRQLSYEELSYHLDDSWSFREFSRLEPWQHPCRSVLQENITLLGDETWEAIHREILLYARRKGIERGRKIRIDSTVVETDIHHPTDSTLLWDGIRVITRWLAEGKELSPEPGYAFCDHTRGAKKRVMIILNAKKDAVRHTAYRELLAYAHRVAGYAVDAVAELQEFNGNTVPDMLAAGTGRRSLRQAVGILKGHRSSRASGDQRVRRSQHRRRSCPSLRAYGHHREEEGIPSTGKGVFICAHRRPFQHDSGLYDWEGQPCGRYQRCSSGKLPCGRMPLKVSADGGFASRDNLAFAKSSQVKAVLRRSAGFRCLIWQGAHGCTRRCATSGPGSGPAVSTLKRGLRP